MSSWTYISGMLKVSPNGMGDHAKAFVLNEVLDHLPLVPGSEGPMEWQVVQSNQYCGSCNHDEFGMRSNLKGRYGWWEDRGIFFVIVDGRLRDTFYEDTLKAFVKWLTRFAKRVRIEDMLVRVSGQKKSWNVDDWHASHTFDGAGYFGKMHLEALRACKDEGLDVRRSSNWRYGLMPESSYWPDILVNLVPGGRKLAQDYDTINGNLIEEEYLKWNGAEYDGVDEHTIDILQEHLTLYDDLMKRLGDV